MWFLYWVVGKLAGWKMLREEVLSYYTLKISSVDDYWGEMVNIYGDIESLIDRQEYTGERIEMTFGDKKVFLEIGENKNV